MNYYAKFDEIFVEFSADVTLVSLRRVFLMALPAYQASYSVL
jgi:hypothetical protein